MLSSLLLSLALADARAAPGVEIEGPSIMDHPGREEIGISALVRVQGLTADQLTGCALRQDRPITESAGAGSFAAARWTPAEWKMLAECEPRRCEYDFSPILRERLRRASPLAEKQRVYYQLLYESSGRLAKTQKSHRILARDLKGEPCSSGGGLEWLLTAPLRPQDPRVWRKVFSRAQPTTVTLQAASWLAPAGGAGRCVGRTLLFADHYLDDLVELYEVQPAAGRLVLRYHLRARFGFFRSWWTRRWKGVIARGIRDLVKRELTSLVARCPGSAR